LRREGYVPTIYAVGGHSNYVTSELKAILAPLNLEYLNDVW